MPKIALLAANGVSEKEMTAIARALASQKTRPMVITPETGLIHTWGESTWGHCYPSDAKIEVSLGSDYDRLIIPGGQRHVDKLMTNPHTKRFVTAMMAMKKPVAVFAEAEKIMTTNGFEKACLSGEADANDCFLEVHAGAGGTEAQDWARCCCACTRAGPSARLQGELLEESDGEEAGIKSATIKIKGHNAYGWLKTESGVHRLVRISPFDSNARRHTSFCLVWVYPVVDDTSRSRSSTRTCASTPIAPRAPAASTSTRPTRRAHHPHADRHRRGLPDERSQHKNRATAMEHAARASTRSSCRSARPSKAKRRRRAKTDIGWGHQIRSYVLQPYQMVKDLRTQPVRQSAERRYRHVPRSFARGKTGQGQELKEVMRTA
jgi:peptide chain release factor 2